MIKLTTNHGVITLDLNAEKAPKTVANFLAYVEAGHYNNTVFHRVIKNFMIQGGGFDTGMNQKKTNPTIENEAANGLKNKRGTVAMARTNDPHSATAQFFINVVDKIRAVRTANKGFHQDVPVEDVIIEKAEIV